MRRVRRELGEVDDKGAETYSGPHSSMKLAQARHHHDPWPIIEAINGHILNGDLYQALKEAKKLVAYEKKLIEQAEAEQQAEAEAQNKPVSSAA